MVAAAAAATPRLQLQNWIDLAAQQLQAISLSAAGPPKAGVENLRPQDCIRPVRHFDLARRTVQTFEEDKKKKKILYQII